MVSTNVIMYVCIQIVNCIWESELNFGVDERNVGVEKEVVGTELEKEMVVRAL